MMNITTPSNGKITVCQLLLPVSIVILVVFISVAFQFTQILRERSAMHAAFAQQATPLEEALKLKAQVNALAVGTKKLAEQGNKGAKTIIKRMEDLGIRVNDGAAQAVPAPGAKGPGGPNAMMKRPAAVPAPAPEAKEPPSE